MDWITRQAAAKATVYRNDGLLVSCGKSPLPPHLTVEVWQILINGNKPAALPGSEDSKITLKPPKD